MNSTYPADAPAGCERRSIFAEADDQANRFKWIRSEEAGYDLGEGALREWVRTHWWGFLRARWIEHLQGSRFWIELDRGDFGLLREKFKDSPHLDPILNMLKRGGENLDIILWAYDNKVSADDVMVILDALNINGHRLCHRFDTPLL